MTHRTHHLIAPRAGQQPRRAARRTRRRGALRVAPSELTRLPLPVPANGDTDSAVEAIRRALMTVSGKRPDGQVVSIAELRERVRMAWSVDYHSRGVALPSLIQNLHSSMATGREGLDCSSWR
jgi:hypothetical protein